MSRDAIHLRADHYAASSAHHLVSKATASVINQFIAIRNTENDPISVIAVTNLVTSHEAANPVDKATSVLYLPEQCTRLDKQATQASSVSDLVLATSRLSLGKSDRRQHSRDRQYSREGNSRSVSREKYKNSWQKDGKERGRSKDSRDSRKDKFHRQSSDKKHDFNATRIRRSSSGREHNFRRSSSGRKHNSRRSSSGPRDKNNRGHNRDKRSKSHSVSKDRGKSPNSRRASDYSNCMRCGQGHLSIDCRQYPFYKGEPCEKCSLMHETKMHRARTNRSNSKEGRPRNTYHIPDHKYRDPGDSVYMTALQPRDKSNDNVFRAPKNP